MDRTGVERWIEAYRRAWTSDDPADIAALFTDDATYSPFPWPRGENLWRGRDEIVRNWIERGDSTLRWRFEHEILAIEDETAVVEGWTFYDRGRGEAWDEAYANVWLIRFADDGRAHHFAEWWIQRPDD